MHCLTVWERKGVCVYAVPVIMMFTLKSVTPLMLDDTLSVSVDAIEFPAPSTVSCLFHVTVIGPFAPVGFQLLVVIVNVIGVLPVFLTYTV